MNEKYIIRSDKITPNHWKLIKKTSLKIYKRMKRNISNLGATKIKFGFDGLLNPVSEYISLR